jgi:ketosteroid isomerase-like protein
LNETLKQEKETMSTEQNIEAVKKAYADFGRQDMASLMGVFDETIVWATPDIGIPPGGTYRGKAEVARFFQQVDDIWEFQEFEPRNYIAAGDQVAVQGYYAFTSKETRKSGTSDWVMVWTFKNGKCTAFQEYVDTAALRDVLSK